MNGYGGGVKSHETAKQSALRELAKESGGVTGTEDDLEQIGFVYFHNTKKDGTEFCCECPIFLLHNPIGDPVDTEEMIEPTWFDYMHPPFNDMMLADEDWLSFMLYEDGLFVAHVYYGPFQQTMTRPTEIQQVDTLPEFSVYYSVVQVTEEW